MGKRKWIVVFNVYRLSVFQDENVLEIGYITM